ncbi:MAG: polysaccharide deacetylase family protein [Eubacterium sp.]|nr:polysaccharide deacetylase family protein [Eubacterium sp.]MCM1216821.1 polysaccharide deacetylase family protein [Lachnospiraceae bacterium]MCM1240619.1 polysaccharide deacetylase family protein [Lachnospiraceae bacterium]
MKTIYVKNLWRDAVKKVSVVKKINWEKTVSAGLFLCAMYFLGREVAATLEGAREAAGTAVSIGVVQQETENWGLGFGKEGEKPVGNASVSEMKQYDAYYMAEGDEKVLYLTFDCGYENGNTVPILDALKKHNAPATFFVVGHFLESAPEIAQRMVEDGHTVGNHTYHHPDMSKISDTASFQKEMDDVAALFQETTGSELAMYYRPPQGKYSTANLQMAKDLGYTTFFWSLAYVDWDQSNQPSHEEAIDKLTSRVHPGAIVLLHSTSQTNGEIMDEILTKWEEMGYTFRSLSDFVEK